MTKKKQKDKKNKQGTIDPESITKLIGLLDAYRILRFEDFRWIDKAVDEKKLLPQFSRDWKNVRKVLWKMATVPHEIKFVKTLQQLRSIILFVGQTIFFAFLFIVILSTLGLPQMALFQPYILYLGIIAIASFILTLVARPLIDGKISFTVTNFYKEHPQRFEKRRAFLKKYVQMQIDAFRTWALKNPDDIDLEKTEIKLYNVDYSGIRIYKPVKWHRKFNVVKLDRRLGIQSSDSSEK
ncbi:MAG: hypothetical protein ACFE9D_10140 [Promethearchaeota archaeon]